MNLTQAIRPSTLDEVVGHQKIITELKKRSEDNNFPQVMMFIGKTGVGKTTLQRIISKNILCQNKDAKGNSCNTCNTCMSIDQEKILLNYNEYDGYDLNIEQARTIEELASKKIPFDKANKRVFVIDELQGVVSKNQQALKKLLKFLERPYKDAHFILGSMEWIKLPEAIKNRTVLYRLDPLDPVLIAQYLNKYCESQKIAIDTQDKAEVLISIASSCGGSMRTAISLLERVIYGNIWTPQEVQKELKVFSTSKINSIIDGVLQGKVEALEDIDFSDEILDSIRFRLNSIYKFKSGLKLEKLEQAELTGIDSRVDIKRVEVFITTLNELMKYNYVTPTLMEFTFLNIINKVKEIPVVRPVRPARDV